MALIPWRVGMFFATERIQRLQRGRLVLALSAILLSSSNAQEAVPPRATPQLIYFTRTGLDLKHNPIDRLINKFGFICEHNKLSPPSCRFEREFVTFLKTIPQGREGIKREVSILGAKCSDLAARLECRYELHVESTNWKVGSHEPHSVADEFFEVTFAVFGERESTKQTSHEIPK
jgi:hypothetical protein